MNRCQVAFQMDVHFIWGLSANAIAFLVQINAEKTLKRYSVWLIFACCSITTMENVDNHVYDANKVYDKVHKVNERWIYTFTGEWRQYRRLLKQNIIECLVYLNQIQQHCWDFKLSQSIHSTHTYVHNIANAVLFSVKLHFHFHTSIHTNACNFQIV